MSGDHRAPEEQHFKALGLMIIILTAAATTLILWSCT